MCLKTDEPSLNRVYGEYGKTFSSELMARKYAKNFKRAWVTKIVDYNNNDVIAEYEEMGAGKRRFLGIHIRKGAKKHFKHWLVTTYPI